MEAEITRLKIEAFNVQTSTNEDEETIADKMWERHIRRMKEKEQNKNI